jgi:hypothetical protein
LNEKFHQKKMEMLKVQVLENSKNLVKKNFEELNSKINSFELKENESVSDLLILMKKQLDAFILSGVELNEINMKHLNDYIK